MNKIEKNLAVYCLLNKETGVYDTFMLSFSDEEAKDYFLNQVANVAFDFSKNADVVNYKKLMNSLKDSCLMRLAIFNQESGKFDNDQVVLLDLLTQETIENFVKSKFELQSKFKDINLADK